MCRGLAASRMWRKRMRLAGDRRPIGRGES